MKLFASYLISLVFLGLSVAGVARERVDLEALTGEESWGCRKAHPAVVNPVVGQTTGHVISLCGEWDFTTFEREGRDENPQRNGIWGKFYCGENWKHARKIVVPGCWEAQGVGKPEMGHSWDAKWDDEPKPLRHVYMGSGWYLRRAAIPSSWAGKRVWLKIGGIRALGHVWVNDRQVAIVNNFCGTYKFEVTDLVCPGGEVKVVIEADNRPPSRKGQMSALHRWGGVYRGVEFEATPQTYVDDVWIRGDFDRRCAQVEVEVVGEQRNDSLSLRATIEDETKEIALRSAPAPSAYTLEIPLRNFRPWSPEHPNLYTGVIELVSNGVVVQMRRERFGVRKLEVRGKDLHLNGKPFFIRGFGDVFVYPLTGHSPADVDVHRRHFEVARKAGFNFVRLHTHCELPEYFEAADELGILIEAELPYYSDVTTEGFAFDPRRDVAELWRNYRRHPSFAVYSMGNEGSFGPDLDRALHQYVKGMDPDRLKINQDCHAPEINPPESSDYLGGPITIWKRGSYNPDRPFVSHEYLNVCVKLDSRLEKDFTGVWQVPYSRAQRAAWLAKFGLGLGWGDRLQDAQHALQGLWQKRGIESARTDPYCDGFIDWTIHDDVVWNSKVDTYGAQGIFDPFWRQKRGGLSATDLAVFNSCEGVFADFPEDRRCFASGETLSLPLRFAHYGDEPIAEARVKWALSADGLKLADGSVAAGRQELGAAREIGVAQIAVPTLQKPVRATLQLEVVGSAAFNRYDLWLFPTRGVRSEPTLAVADELAAALKGRYADTLPASRAVEADVVLAPYGSPLAKEALARGQKVITLEGCDGKANVSLGWWWMGGQVGTAFRNHAAFGTFPHQGILNELFFRILKPGRKLPFQGLSEDDMLAVGEGGDACYLYLGQAKVGAGSLLMSFGLDVLDGTCEGAALLDRLIDYAKSTAFAPCSFLKVTDGGSTP